LKRFPAEPAPWDSVRHLYEIGRAPENVLHPEYTLAQELAQGFWASLPHLDPQVIALILARGRRVCSFVEAERLADTVNTEAFRASLGRIACAYDGGQIPARCHLPFNVRLDATMAQSHRPAVLPLDGCVPGGSNLHHEVSAGGAICSKRWFRGRCGEPRGASPSCTRFSLVTRKQ